MPAKLRVLRGGGGGGGRAGGGGGGFRDKVIQVDTTDQPLLDDAFGGRRGTELGRAGGERGARFDEVGTEGPDEGLQERREKGAAVELG